MPNARSSQTLIGDCRIIPVDPLNRPDGHWFVCDRIGVKRGCFFNWQDAYEYAMFKAGILDEPSVPCYA